MAFDPITLLTINLFLSVSLGAVLIRISQGEAEGPALRGWGCGLVVSGIGTALTLLSPGSEQTLCRSSGLALLVLAHAVIWGAGRALLGRPWRMSLVLVGPLLWCAVLPLGLAAPWRILVSSALRAAYAVAAARDLGAGRPGGSKPRRWLALLLAAHGGFMIARAVLGGPVQSLWPTPTLVHLQMAATGIETVLFTGVFGMLAVMLSREAVVDAHRRAAEEDTLTGIGNRRALSAAWSRLADRPGDDGQATSLLLMDLDRFKAVNDRHGHDAGDRMLSAFAEVVRDRLPASGRVFRIGGEEFVVLLAAAEASTARAVAEDLRRSFGRVSIAGPNGPISTTVSIGIARGTAASSDVGDLLRRADRNLYAAKAEGRNRIVDEAEPQPVG